MNKYRKNQGAATLIAAAVLLGVMSSPTKAAAGPATRPAQTVNLGPGEEVIVPASGGATITIVDPPATPVQAGQAPLRGGPLAAFWAVGGMVGGWLDLRGEVPSGPWWFSARALLGGGSEATGLAVGGGLGLGWESSRGLRLGVGGDVVFFPNTTSRPREKAEERAIAGAFLAGLRLGHFLVEARAGAAARTFPVEGGRETGAAFFGGVGIGWLFGAPPPRSR